MTSLTTTVLTPAQLRERNIPRCSDCLLTASGYRSAPDIQTPLTALGAVMETIITFTDWKRRAVALDLRKFKLPTIEEMKSLRIPDVRSMNEVVRSYTSYECHDIHIAVVNPDGSLKVLYCERTDPALERVSHTRELHAAPINGFNWPIGGRRMCAMPGTSLENTYGCAESAVVKAFQEAGIRPEMIKGIYNLGVGRTEFNREMTYLFFDQESQAPSRKSIVMDYPQRTVNTNYVFIVDDIEIKADATVKNFKFITEKELQRPEIRAKFSPYYLKFLDALFTGWKR